MYRLCVHNSDSVLCTHTTDGHYVCPGNYLAVPFYGERRTFRAVQVTSSTDQPAHGDLFSGSILDSSILQGMSGLSLNHTPSKHCVPDFSTPKTDSSTAEADLELNLPDGSPLEPEWDDPVYLSSVTKYHSLPENQSCESMSPGTVRSEVIVHKLTTKTKIQFVAAQREEQQQNKVQAVFQLLWQCAWLRTCFPGLSVLCGRAAEADSAAPGAGTLPTGGARLQRLRQN